jgi:hypothetical protein
MSTEASSFTRRLLNAGRIRGESMEPGTYGRVNVWISTRAIELNRTMRNGSVFDDSTELGKTLVHEGKHVQQFQGMRPGLDAVNRYRANLQRLENEAYAYQKIHYLTK